MKFKSRIVALTALAFVALGCDSSEVRRPPVKTDPKLVSIAIAPPTAMIAKGETITLAAMGTYDDETTKDVTLLATWRSLSGQVASVTAEGKVTGLSVGTAELHATLGDVFGDATITVTSSALVSLSVTPATVAIPWGKTATLTATARFADGTTTDATNMVVWSSSAEGVATVAQGTVAAVSEGTATITAREAASGMSATAEVTVGGPRPVSLVILPTIIELPVGHTLQLSASARFEDGVDRDVTSSVQWASTNATSASVGDAPGSKGLVTALAVGIGSITATDVATGVHGAVTARVIAPIIETLTIAPLSATIGRGATQAFHATAHYSDGSTRDFTNAATWTSSDEAVATLATGPGQRGVFLGIGAGTSTISARDPASGVGSDDSNASVRLDVTAPTLRSITVLPLTLTIPLGLSRSFQAFGVFSDGSSIDITGSVEWRTSNASVATIDAAGTLTTVGAGQATISAVDPVTGIDSDASRRSCALVVTPPELLSITVTPRARAMIVGGTQAFVATGRFTDGLDVDLTTQVQWASSGSAITMSATGVATAVDEGVVTISATDPTSHITSDASNGSATVTVSAATLLSIAVTPTSTTVPAGAEVQFSAIGSYDNGATADLTNLVDWSSSSPGTAEVSNATGSRGVAVASAAGSVVITALEPLTGVSSAASTQSGALTVSSAVTLSSLAVTPRTAIVDVSRTRQLHAIGTFSDGHLYPMTNAVTWSSSSPANATVSNVPGARGLVTGVAVGMATVSALHGSSGIASGPLSAALTIELGIVTLSGAYPGPQVSIDATPDYGVNVGSVSFSASSFPPAATVSHVTVSINFLKTDGTCALPDIGSAYHNETNFRLLSPTGATVVLATTNTWSGGAVISPVTVVFDQNGSATPTGTPVSGTFRPNGGDLSTLNGTNPAGTWVLQAGDSAGGDPLCVNNYTITVTAE